MSEPCKHDREAAASSDVLEIKRDNKGEYRWHRKATNGEVISSGEGYATHAGAITGALRANPGMTGVVEVDSPDPSRLRRLILRVKANRVMR